MEENGEPLFRVVTPYSKAEYRKFQRFHRWKFRKWLYFFVGIETLLLCLLSIEPGRIRYFLLGWVLFLGLYLIALLLRQRQINRSPYAKLIRTNVIYPTKVQLITERSDTTVMLEDVLRVCETADAFYIYMTRNSAMILTKAGFELGTPEQLSQFFYYKIPTKYRLYS